MMGDTNDDGGDDEKFGDDRGSNHDGGNVDDNNCGCGDTFAIQLR